MFTPKPRMLLSALLCVALMLAGTTAALAESAALPAPADEAPFDPSLFGRVLSEEEIDAIDGNGLLVAVVGGFIGAVAHVALNGIDLDSPEWWLGLAVSVALGAIPGFF